VVSRSTVVRGEKSVQPLRVFLGDTRAVNALIHALEPASRIK
jgi:hypothetical protein